MIRPSDRLDVQRSALVYKFSHGSSSRLILDSPLPGAGNTECMCSSHRCSTPCDASPPSPRWGSIFLSGSVWRDFSPPPRYSPGPFTPNRVSSPQ